MEDFFRIKVNNWTKFNPRCDVKKPSWFRVDNSLFENPEMYHLKPDEMAFLIYILSLASKKNGDELTLSTWHAVNVARFLKTKIIPYLEALCRLEIIMILDTSRSRYVGVTDAIVDVTDAIATLQDKTLPDKTNTTTHTNTKTSARERAEFDFEKVYRLYPRKEGKHLGMRKLKTIITTQKEFEDFEKAVECYKAHLKRQGTEPRFIKQFSTFVTSWRDWLEPDAGNATNLVEKHDYSDIFAKLEGVGE